MHPLTSKILLVTTTRAQDEPLISTYGRLLEANSRLAKILGAPLEAEAGIPLTWFEVLLRLSRSPGSRLTMGELSAQLALTTGGVTRLVDRLVESGYVERVSDPGDRRVARAVLTHAGRRAVERGARVHVVGLREVFAGFSEADVARLDTLLDRLRDQA
jgi:DNA-binding MarR family transcriptional regulator